MRTCIGFPSYSSIAAWSTSAAMNAAYPVTNLSDMINLRRGAATTANGAAEFDFVLSSAQPIQLVSLINHNLQAGATVDIKLYSDSFSTLVFDSGTVSVWPASTSAAPPFTPCCPVLLPSPVAALTGKVTIAPGSQIIQLSAIDLAGAALWDQITSAQSRGFNPQTQKIKAPGGGYHNFPQWNPRTFVGHQDAQARAQLESTMLDFKSLGLSRPFVFVRDIDDPTVWPREAYVATHKTLQNSVTDGPESGSDDFSIEEYLG